MAAIAAASAAQLYAGSVASNNNLMSSNGNGPCAKR
eukprot:CAMPEP_0176146570 /NCGR_PEP_ID=MMETSP0120_2-20121206/74696_1 /TAXON_ID=160619 /ORGANISM="Kryptoperidinium foliaceum, Strain CCMP 1326" /LENGTH=35 /DNA_ID= /DNA_START= /DNA_END= /DNA_ORIENTATION=